MDNILSILYEYGWFFGIFLLLSIILFKYIVKNFDNWVKDKKLMDEIISDDTSSLKYHPFFSKNQYRLVVEVPNLNSMIHKPVRDRIFKDLLDISIKSIYNIANNIIENQNINSWSVDKWTDVMTQAINKIVIDTEDKARKEGIPDIVIQKYMKWHMETIETLLDHVILLGNSKLYNTNVVKINTLLLVMDLSMETILGDAERVLHELNGEISGLKYKGQIIE